MKRAIIGKVLAGVMAISALASAVTGCSECAHDVGEWQTVRSATCGEQGSKKGVCALCLEEVYEDIPTNPDAHAYGEWAVTVPTESKTGSALKTCAHDATHTLKVTLPVLSNQKYVSSVTTRPSALGDGVRTFKYEHLMGTITFTTPISANGIKTVRDAVDVLSAEESHALIRNASGKIGYEYHLPEIRWTDGNGQEQVSEANDQVYHHDYSYEFGEDYTHIEGGTYDNTERWYGVDSEGVYGFAQVRRPVLNAQGQTTGYTKEFYYETGREVQDAENYIDGFRFVLMYETELGAYYGAENLLAGLYRSALLSTNEDFAEKVTKVPDGDTVYSFQFGHYNRETNGLFGNVKVQFTMTEEYTIKTLDVQSIVYINNSGWDAQMGGNYNTWELKEVNGKQVARLKEGKENGARYVDVISVTQQTKEETKTQPVPENPYQRNAGVIYESYELKHNGVVIEDGHDPIPCSASREGDNALRFAIGKIKPSSAVTLGVDGFYFYYRDKEGVDHAIDYNSLSRVGVNAYMDGAFLTVRSQIAGLVDIVVKTAGTERVIHLNVAKIAPSTLYPALYKYAPTGYTESKYAVNECEATVYVGQPLYFKANSPEAEVNYTDATCTSAVMAGNADACAIVDAVNREELPFFVKEGVTVSSFTATEAGTYTLTLTSAKSSGAVCTITVNVLEKPAITDILSNEYVVNLEYPVKGRATVGFTTESGVTKATVNFNGNRTVLQCNYDAEKGTLGTVILEGGGLLSNTEYNFSLSLNEAYDLVLSHPLGSDYEGMQESAVIWRDISGILSGVYTADLQSPVAGSATVTFATSETDGTTATVEYNGQTVRLSCEYDLVNKTLTTSVVGEVEEAYQFSLRFNASYQLVLSHVGDGGALEEVLLLRP